MASSQQSKISVDVAADNSSFNSLSFSGLVCIQDQKPKNHPKNCKQSARQDQSFEFSRSAIESLELIPDLQLLQQLSQPQAKQCQDSSHRISEGSTPATQNGETTNDVRGTSKPDRSKIRNKAARALPPSSGLGCKMFQSFMSPCRECQAVKPDVKAPTVQRENNKSH